MSTEEQNRLAELAEQAEPSASSLFSQSASATPLESESDEHDDSVSDIDSAIGSWRSSRTQSLTSSIVDFKYENGRRYHSYREGSYHIPNDEHEQDRLDMQHEIYRIALENRLYFSPLRKEKIQDVLDVGCGTGLWCIDMADDISHAQVVGFDLSPIQPDMVPPNCRFYVDDCNSEWVFESKFDLIHTRAMTPSIKNWPRYLQQAYNQLKPGGYIELHEGCLPAGCTESTASPTPSFVQWSQFLIEAGAKVELDFTAPKKLRSMLQDAGFTDITINWQNWPVGPWARGNKNKQIGRWWAEDMKDAAKNTAALFTRILGWESEEFEVFAAKIRNEIETGKSHMWTEMCFAFARKPFPNE